MDFGGPSGDDGSTDSDRLLCPDEPHPDAKFYYPRTPDDTLVQIEQWLTSDPDIEVDFGYDDEGRKTALVVGIPGRMSYYIMANSRFKEIRVEMVISEDPEVIAKATPDALGRIYSMGAAPGGIWVEDGSLMMGMSLAVTAMARDGISDQLSRFVSYRGVVEQLLIEGGEAGEADGTD